tara:strand:+ start:944 stop:1129 length:186 start_codon:yes stop_codon:yes gene_type:complete
MIEKTLTTVELMQMTKEIICAGYTGGKSFGDPANIIPAIAKALRAAEQADRNRNRDQGSKN